MRRPKVPGTDTRSLITINHNWRVIYEVASACIGLILVLAFFAFPETAFTREKTIESPSPSGVSGPIVDTDGIKEEGSHTDLEHAPSSQTLPKRKSYLQTLRLFSGTHTDEHLYKIFLRPLGLICLPPILWSALVESVTIGFLVAVTSNVDSAFEATYGFESWQVGVCFISACIGALIGIPAGGQLGDLVADYLTRRNHGIREPEMRLPAMIPSLITTPLALVLYGVGVQHKLHWICPTIGLGLCECLFLFLFHPLLPSPRASPDFLRCCRVQCPSH